MSKISARGNILFNSIVILLILTAAGLYLRPYYEHYAMQKAFNAVLKGGNDLYSAAQVYYIAKRVWPSSMLDLRDNLGSAKLVSDWVAGDKHYTCEITYGRGDRPTNDMVCSARGRFKKVLLYQLSLSDKKLNKRYCWAPKSNKTANHICVEAGGVFSHAVGGQAKPYRVYQLKR